MLSKRFPRPGAGKSIARQTGIVLAIALIVLVAMTLAAIAMVRSVDTTTLIAGNMAMQQSALHAADSGVEAAIKFLEGCKADSTACGLSNNLGNDEPTYAYTADGSNKNPAPGQSWDQYWPTSPQGRSQPAPDQGDGNKVRYIIDRMCAAFGRAGDSATKCMTSPAVASGNNTYGDGEEANERGIGTSGTSAVYYRITVRVAGPNNTVSYIQVVVAI